MNPLLKLLAQNKGLGRPLNMEHSEEEATIYLYDVIVYDDYWDGISAREFVPALNKITAPVIHLRIDCPGGDVFPARAMAQAIREHPSKIIAHIDGSCASAATFLAVAADESFIAKGAQFMIHKAWTFGAGNADDFVDLAERLNAVDETIVDDYHDKTGSPPDLLRDLVAAETYFYGQEAVEAGFIDAIADVGIKNKIEWNLSAYGHSPVTNKELKAPKKITPEPEPEKPDLSAHYRQLSVVELTA